MKVSVCLMAYNHEGWIAQAIDGVLMQDTDFEYELIIGEDDSSDNTRNIVKEYKRKHPDKITALLNDRRNVIYIHGRPTGRWNLIHTLHHASGEYVALLDGDDHWISPHKLQKQVDFLDSHPECALCFHKAEAWSEASDRSLGILPLPRYRRDSTLEDLLHHSFVPTCTAMFRRGLFGDFPDWYYEVPVGDWPLFILNAQYGRIGYIDEVLAVYRQHSQGVWSGLDAAAQIRQRIRVYEALGHHLDGRYRRIAQSMLAIQHFYLAAEYYRAGDPEAASQSMDQVLGQFPVIAELWQEYALSLALKIEDTEGYDAAVKVINWTFDAAETRPDTTRWIRGLRREWHTVHAFKAHQEGDRATVRRMAWRAVRDDWRVLGNRGFRSISLAACLGPRTWRLLRQHSRRLSQLGDDGLSRQES